MDEHEEYELSEAEERLRRAWHARPPAPAPVDFAEGVMRDVRARAGARGGPGNTAQGVLERAVRLGAIAAGLLTAAVGLGALGSGAWTSGDLYVLLRSHPETLLEWLLVF